MRRPLPAESEQLLDRGIAQLGIAASAQATQQLLALLELLQEWNRTFNLTSIRDPLAMIPGHLLDSLSVLPNLPAGSLLDLGCGAGFPGLPIAILQPHRPVTLLDSNQKKTRFVHHAAAQLGLTNCTVIHSRVEQFTPPARFANVICRAYSALNDFAEQAGRLISDEGALHAMKGQRPTEEINQLADHWRLEACVRLEVPNTNSTRHLVTLRKSAAISSTAEPDQ